MMGLKLRCSECNDSIEENKLSNILKDKIMKESIRKNRMLRKEEKAKTVLKQGKHQKLHFLQKQSD